MIDWIKVFLMSMLPIAELRGAIPLGVSMGLPLWEVTLLAIVGNALIVPILLVITEPLFKYLKTLKGFRGWVEKYEARAAKKIHSYRKFRFLGLVLLVGIPIPTTGVYTGVVASRVLNMSFKVALAANVLGVLMSGTIVYMISHGYLNFFM